MILAGVFCTGKYLGHAIPESQPTFNYEIQNADKVTGKVTNESGESTIERAEYKPAESTVLNHLENPKLLRNFQNFDELERWLENVKIQDISSDAVAKETDQGITSFDCDDYALKLQEKALQDGYMISFEVIYSDEYGDLFKQGQIPDGAIHAINSVIIGNEIYYIEPANHEIAFVACLD